MTEPATPVHLVLESSELLDGGGGAKAYAAYSSNIELGVLSRGGSTARHV